MPQSSLVVVLAALAIGQAAAQPTKPSKPNEQPASGASQDAKAKGTAPAERKVVKAASDKRSASPWDGPAFSASGADVIDALEANPTGGPDALECLVIEEEYRLDEQGRHVHRRHRVWRCLTDQCLDDYSYLETSWAPWYEDRPVIRARVITPDKVVHQLEPDTIIESSIEQQSSVMWSDRKTLQAPLPALRVGAVVEDEVVVRETQPFFAAGETTHVMMAHMNPVRKLRLTIDYPQSLSFRYEQRGFDAKPTETKTNGRVQLSFQVGPLKALKPPEANMPTDVARFPEVAFTTGKSWEDVAASYAAIVEPRFDPERVRSMVREVVGDETDRQRIIARLLAKVHDLIRYTALEFGAAAITPRPITETLTRRYGDCKDHAILFGSMLRAAGIPAYMTLISVSSRADIVPSLPGMGVFDHVIIYIPGPPEMWIDPTDTFSRAGELAAMECDRWVLVAKPGSKGLVRTPRVDYRRNTITETVEYLLSDSDSGRVRETMVWEGDCASTARAGYAAQGDVAIRKGWREYGKRIYKSGAISTLEHPSPRDLEKPFTLTAEIDNVHVSDTGPNGELTVVIRPTKILRELPDQFTARETKPEEREPDEEDRATRRSPLELHTPYIHQVVYRVVPPEGYTPRTTPENVALHHGPATFTVDYRIEEGRTVVATLRLDTGPGRFTADEVNAMRQALAKLATDGDIDKWTVPITFDHSASKQLAAGNVREGLAEYRRLVDQHRKSARHRLQYAEALITSGMGALARQVAWETVTELPQSAEAHGVLARVLTYDLMGRRFRPGYHRAGALAAFRRALELDPSNWRLRWDYGLLLQFDEFGFRFATDASEQEQAMVQFLHVRRAIFGDELDQQLALLLLHRNRFRELEEFARLKKSTPAWNSFILAAATVQRGQAAAEEVLASRPASSRERQQALAAAVELLHSKQLYPQCRLLLQVAFPVLADDASARQRFEALKRTRPLTETLLPENEPTRAVQELYRVAIATACSEESLRPLFSKAVPDADFLHARTMLANEIGMMVRSAWQQGTIPAAAVDVLLSNVGFESLGSASTGWRVCFESSTSNPLDGWYVVRESGGFRIVGNVSSVSVIARVAMRVLSSGDVATAAKWLDRAFAAYKPTLTSPRPSVGVPFARLWNEVPHDDLRMVRLAIATLSVEGMSPDPANIVVLESYGHELQTTLKAQVDRALAKAYFRVGRPEDALAAIERLPKAYAESDIETCRFQALCQLDRFTEAQAIAREAVNRADTPEADADAWAFSAAWTGASPEGEKHLRHKIENKAKPLPDPQRATFLSQLAWAALLQGHANEQTLNEIQEANRLTNYQNRNALCTLAAYYAEKGKVSDAVKYLHNAVDASVGEMGGEVYYILGRVAEDCSLPDSATSFYRKVPRDLAAAHIYYATQKRLEEVKKQEEVKKKEGVKKQEEVEKKEGAKKQEGVEKKEGVEKQEGVEEK
jgi:tetratricopeptide (TPR) repeat protein